MTITAKYTPSISPTAYALEHLQLHGHRAFEDEPDHRLLPDGKKIADAVADIFDVLDFTLTDTRLEDDRDNLMWGAVNVFQRALYRIKKELDRNEVAQRRLQTEQDGTEVKSLELERLIEQGKTLLERESAMEIFRDVGMEAFESYTKKPWKPYAGSVVSHRHMTAALIDSRDYIAAKRRADISLMAPQGTMIVVSGGADYKDHNLVCEKLKAIVDKCPDMIVVTGGNDKGAEFFAERWAASRKVPVIKCQPDWNKHSHAAPFKRNDLIIDMLPRAVLVFGGNGINANLRDKARGKGITVHIYQEPKAAK